MMHLKYLKVLIAGVLLITCQYVSSQTNEDSFYGYVELSMQLFTNQITESDYINSVGKFSMIKSPAIKSKIFNYQVFNKRRELAKRAGVKVVDRITEQDWQKLLKTDSALYANLRSSNLSVYSDTPVESIRLLKAELIARSEKKAVAQVAVALGQELSFRDGETIAALIEYLYALPELPIFANSSGDYFYSKEFVLRRVISSFYLMGAYERANEYIQQLFSINKQYLDSVDYPEPYFQIAFVLAQVGKYEEALDISNQLLQNVEAAKLSNSAKLYGLIAKAGVLIYRHEGEDLKVASDILSSASLNTDSNSVSESARSISIKTLLYALQGDRNNVLSSIKRLEEYVNSHRNKFKDADLRDIAELERLSYELIHEPELALKASSVSLMSDKNLILRSLNTSLDKLGNYLQRDVELLILERIRTEHEKQALQLKSQKLRLIILSLVMLLLVLLAIWLWQRQRFTKKLAETDTLTGAMNRRAMYNWINKLMPMNTDICVCLIDLDHFKKINDTYGHVTGDEVLEAFSTIVKNRIRKTDRLCRFGGEEFLLTLIGLNKKEARALIAEIRGELEACNRWKSNPSLFSVSFSAGIIQLKGKAELDSVISQCDDLLYRAKANGRAKTESANYSVV